MSYWMRISSAITIALPITPRRCTLVSTSAEVTKTLDFQTNPSNICLGNFMGSRHFSEGGYDRIAIKLFQKLNVAYLTLLPPTLEVSHSLLLGHITSSMIRQELGASSPCSTCLRTRTLSSASLPPSSQSLRTSRR